MNLPELPRQPIRPDKEPDVDPEIWKPEWKCFCCHDYGIIQAPLTALVIPNYNHWRDKPPVCQRCAAGSSFIGSEHYDQRFNRSICSELDKIERENWANYVRSRLEAIAATKALAKEKSLRERDRTPEEEQAIAERRRLTTEEDWGLVAQSPSEKKWITGWEGEG